MVMINKEMAKRIVKVLMKKKKTDEKGKQNIVNLDMIMKL